MSYTASKYREALKLLTESSTSFEKFESIKIILEGQNNKLDQLLEKCSKSLEKIENLASGDIISLATDSLPEDSEKEKKRKKAIILFIKNFKQLRSEVQRIKTELDKQNTGQSSTYLKIFALAKGPVGIVTAVALIIVLFLGAVGISSAKKAATAQPQQTTASPRQKIQVINFNGKQLPLDQLRIGTGTDCDSPHYHAKDEVSARATNGTQIPDPGSCGYGKLKETPTQQIEI